MFRGLPVNIVSDPWFIAGKISTDVEVGGGILEWCIDENDAKMLLNEMKKDSRFSNLRIGRWSEEV